jgi:RNA polymerase sigma-70 factor (ECF subfamily)
MELGGSVARRIERSTGAPEHELLRLAADGNRDAFDALIRPRLDRLYRMAFAITRSEADARDATQDACVLAWREVGRLRDRSKFDPWLSQIVVNAARGLVRRTSRTQVRELSVEASQEVVGDRAEPAIAAESDSVADSDAIQRAFSRLDAGTRTLLVLHYVEERPLAEIARLTGAPVGTVKWRLSNARRALEKALRVEQR